MILLSFGNMKQIYFIFLMIIGIGGQYSVIAQLPQGFEHTLFTDQAPNLTTLEFAENGYIYGSEFNGRIWLFINEELQPNPVIDISEEVNGNGELGCLGFALHPDFMENGYLYMFYVVDRHHLIHYGTDNYDPDKNQYGDASMGRVTRFQISTDDYQTLVPDSRTVMFGESIGEGNPSLTLSHGTGDILFGSDGTLIFSTGDGNTWEENFAGGDQEIPPVAYDKKGLAEGIISEEENVGAYRAQQIQSYSGKVLRIDPLTGAGIPSNPFYDEDDPHSARSKVWALGLRNPYRMTLRPGTGSEDPADANPGKIYITDVGAADWEEVNICDGPGYNFGWPLYEGMSINWGFYPKYRKNLFQPNPLGDSCDQHFFTFHELIQQEREDHNYHFPNPCNAEENIEEYADVFYQIRPSLTYRNDAWNIGGSYPLIPTFDSTGKASFIEVIEPELEVEGAADIAGIAAMTGDFYAGSKFPREYHLMLPILDYHGWLKVLWFDENQKLTKMEHWLGDLENVIDIRYNPNDECYYTMGLWPARINKICYTANLSPILDVHYTPKYGSAPLEVTFDASSSYDPENDPLIFEWDFGDGSYDTGAVITHEFMSTGQGSHSYIPVLTVTDTSGNSTSEQMLVSLNNTPPKVKISSVDNDQIYSMQMVTKLLLEADVNDPEHSIGELDYEWVTYLHHNTHFHPLTESNENSTVFHVNPVGCEEVDEYFYRISLKVTDPEGLEGYDEVFIYPDCEGKITRLEDELILYPNPTKDNLKVRFRDVLASNREYSIEIFNISGQMVLEGKYKASQIENLIELDVEGLLEGSYIFRATYGDTGEYIRQFLIIRN